MFETLEHGWGLALILYFQSLRTPLIINLALIFHFIGSEAFFLPITMFIYWSVDKHLGRRLLPFVLFASWLNAAVKDSLRRPRPYNVSAAVDNVLSERSYGIPSGHAQNATVVGGVTAAPLRRWWILIATVAYAVLTGISRMILGVHYPQDVVLGILMGLLLLGFYGVVAPHIESWLGARSYKVKLAAVIITTAVMALIHPVLIPVTSPEWLAEAIPVGDLLARVAIPIGSFLGVGVGLILEDRFLNFDWRGSWSQRTLRCILGLTGIGILFYLLSPLGKFLPIPLLGDLIRFSLIGLWVAYGAPWLFIRFGLSSRTLKTDPYAES